MLEMERTDDGLYYITKQVDAYPIQELPLYIVPFSKQLVQLIKVLVGFLCMLYALFFQQFGCWTVGRAQAAL